MEKKYFDTKQGSVEEKINTIATSQPSISKPVTDVKLSVDKKYFETKKHRRVKTHVLGCFQKNG